MRIRLLIFLLPDVLSVGTGSCIAAWLSAPQVPGGINLLKGPQAEARLLLSPSCYTSMASRILKNPATTSNTSYRALSYTYFEASSGRR